MKVGYVELAGEKHPLCFSLTATQEACERFGSLDEMYNQLRSDDIGTVAYALNVLLEVMMDAGRIYEEYAGHPVPAPIGCKPGDLIDMASAKATILSTMISDTQRTVEAEGKNLEATQES